MYVFMYLCIYVCTYASIVIERRSYKFPLYKIAFYPRNWCEGSLNFS